jgi:hypothetical protein
VELENKTQENETLMQTVTKSMATFNKHKDQIEALTKENE